MTDEQIKHMVDRFLMWKLPENFNPDAGISYVRPNYPASWPGPTGTNLFDANQADAMVRHMIDGMPNALSVPDVEKKKFYGAECPSYPNCSGGCGLGCTHDVEAAGGQK